MTFSMDSINDKIARLVDVKLVDFIQKMVLNK